MSPFASPAVPERPRDPTAALVRVIPTTSPRTKPPTELVERLRGRRRPGRSPAPALDGRTSPGPLRPSIDFTGYLAERLFVFFGVVLALSFLLLMVVFRSLLVPLKAVIMNLLSIAAAYGVVVAVFQWGWLSSVIGVERRHRSNRSSR